MCSSVKPADPSPREGEGAPISPRRLLVTVAAVALAVPASWRDPCRAEFPFFARLARKYEGRVPFLGVDSQDSRADAARFLRELPVPFPHYFDDDAAVARVFGGGRAWPTTAFYTPDGKLSFFHQGAYATEAKLEEDLRRYALGG